MHPLLGFQSRLRLPVFLALAIATSRPASSATCPASSLFQPQSFVTTGQFSVSVANGDFNSDGVKDLAVSNLNDNTVSILLGTGGGAFAPQVTYPAGSQPRGVAAADVNGDGILDLVVTDVGTSTVSVLIGLGSGGHGNGTFAAPITYVAGFQNRGVVVTDLNHDGHPDIVCAGRTSMAVLLNSQTAGAWGTFPTVTNYPTPSSWGVTAGDFNGDGNMDIAAGDWLDARVDIFLGNGAGSFSPGTPVVTPGGCSDITSGDLNGDGVMDLVAAGSTGIWVMIGHGDGKFGVSAFANTGDQFNSAIIVDVNGDGIPDILGTDTSTSQLVVLPGAGSGLLWRSRGLRCRHRPDWTRGVRRRRRRGARRVRCVQLERGISRRGRSAARPVPAPGARHHHGGQGRAARSG